MTAVKVQRCRAAAASALACERSVGLTRLRFVWTGGIYIAVSAVGGPVREVINVWDYERSQPRINFTLAALERRVDDWIWDYPPNQLIVDALWY